MDGNAAGSTFLAGDKPPWEGSSSAASGLTGAQWRRQVRSVTASSSDPFLARILEELSELHQDFTRAAAYLRDHETGADLRGSDVLTIEIGDARFFPAHHAAKEVGLGLAWRLSKRCGLTVDVAGSAFPAGKAGADFRLEEALAPVLEVPPVLRAASPVVELAPLCAFFIEDPLTQTVHFVFWNLFEDAPRFVESLPARLADGEGVSRLAERYFPVAKSFAADFDFDAALAALPPVDETEADAFRTRRAFDLVPSGSDSAAANWRALTDAFTVAVAAAPFGASHDRDVPVTVVPPDFARDLSGHALHVDGFLYSVKLQPQHPDEAEAWGAALQRQGLTGPCRDSHGNVVIPDVRRLEHDPDRVILRSLVIYPPLALNPAGVDGAFPFSADLSVLGLGDFPDLMTVSGLAPLSGVGTDYRFYSTLPEATLSHYPDLPGIVADAARAAERDLAAAPGALAHGFLLVPSAGENATTCSYNAPDTVVLWEEVLPRLDARKGDFVIRHEIYHLFDARYDISEHAAFARLFMRYSESRVYEFFSRINESALLGTGFGGHAGDNAAEFFATLMNSVDAPDWRAKVIALPEADKTLYLASLSALKEALEERFPSYMWSNFYPRLCDRIAELTPLESAELSLKDVLPPRFKVSVALAAPSVRFVHTAAEWDAAVLGNPRPVIVCRYREPDFERYNEIVAELARRHGGEADVVAVDIGAAERDPALLGRLEDAMPSRRGDEAQAVPSLAVYSDGVPVYRSDVKERGAGRGADPKSEMLEEIDVVLRRLERRGRVENAVFSRNF